VVLITDWFQYRVDLITDWFQYRVFIIEGHSCIEMQPLH